MLKRGPQAGCDNKYGCEDADVLCPGCERFTVKQRARINQAVVVSAFLLLLGATGVLVWFSINSHDSAVQVALSRRADAKQAAMGDALSTWARLADHVGRVMAVLPNTTTDAYRFFVAGSSPELDVPALVSVTWAVPVANDPAAIAEYEEYARRVTGCPTATINYHAASNFSWRPTPEQQPTFLPFTQTTFGSSAEMACGAAFVGFDLLAIEPSNAARRNSTLAVIQAEKALASTPLDTAGTAIAHLGIVQSVLAPVFVEGEFVGLASAAFQASDLVAAGAVADDEAVVHATLTDVETGMVLSSDVAACHHSWVEYRNVSFGGRTWELMVVGDDEFAEAVPNEAIWTSLLACILAAVVGALVLARVRDEAILARATKRLLLQMSHDLRTPLHSIWHAAQEIASLPCIKDNAAAMEPTVTLKWCATLAKNILDNILDMSHISKGTLDVVNRPADVLAALATAVTIMRATAEDGGTRLKFDGEQTGPVCLVDTEKLIRVVLNIIGNAIKFAPGGLVQVKVTLDPARLYSESGSGRLSGAAAAADARKFILRVAVQDNGHGMDEATLATATRAYAHASSTRGGGSGIGLHVAKTIVEQYSGALNLDSPGLDLGSTVSFFMVLSGSDGTPADRSAWTTSSGGSDQNNNNDNNGSVRIEVGDDAAAAAAAAATTTTTADPGPQAVDRGAAAAAVEPVVLVVDDSRLNRRVAMHALRGLKNVLIEQCVDGLEALGRLKALTQDVPRRRVFCLMDQSMPNMGGAEATRQYREWAAAMGVPRAEQAWICVLTGDVVTNDRHFQDPGFDHRLTKPCPADTMQRLLREQLGWPPTAAPPAPAVGVGVGVGSSAPHTARGASCSSRLVGMATGGVNGLQRVADAGDDVSADSEGAVAAKAAAAVGAAVPSAGSETAEAAEVPTATSGDASGDGGGGGRSAGRDEDREDDNRVAAASVHAAIFSDAPCEAKPPTEQNDDCGSSKKETELPSWIQQGGGS